MFSLLYKLQVQACIATMSCNSGIFLFFFFLVAAQVTRGAQLSTRPVRKIKIMLC